MSIRDDGTLQCDMRDNCHERVTHIGEKGFVYCRGHIENRRGYERCRTMAAWEIILLEDGFQLMSYKPITKQRDAELRVAKAAQS